MSGKMTRCPIELPCVEDSAPRRETEIGPPFGALMAKVTTSPYAQSLLFMLNVGLAALVRRSRFRRLAGVGRLGVNLRKSPALAG